MNIEELIADLRARVNPQYYDQPGTESYERQQCVMALESLLARNDVLREENERLRKDAERIDWISRQYLDGLCLTLVVDADHDGEYYVAGDDNQTGYGPTLRAAIDAARSAKTLPEPAP